MEGTRAQGQGGKSLPDAQTAPVAGICIHLAPACQHRLCSGDHQGWTSFLTCVSFSGVKVLARTKKTSPKAECQESGQDADLACHYPGLIFGFTYSRPQVCRLWPPNKTELEENVKVLLPGYLGQKHLTSLLPRSQQLSPSAGPHPHLHSLTSGSSLLHSKGICHLIQGSLARAQSGVARKHALRAPVHGAVTIGRVQVPVREVREELGTVVETLGLSNVCRRQATGISQAAGHKTQSESLDASGWRCPALFTRSLSLALTG